MYVIPLLPLNAWRWTFRCMRLNGNPGETVCPPSNEPKGWLNFALETIKIDNSGQPFSDFGVHFCYADPRPPTPTAAPTVSTSSSPRADLGCCVFWDTTLIQCQCDGSYLYVATCSYNFVLKIYVGRYTGKCPRRLFSYFTGTYRTWILRIEEGAFDFAENENILTLYGHPVILSGLGPNNFEHAHRRNLNKTSLERVQNQVFAGLHSLQTLWVARPIL